jgi:ABC-2 type transport system permease protein
MIAELRAAVGAELIKVRRSVMLWATAVAFVVAACVGAFFMFVLQDPARARSLGLLGAKAQLSGGTADWPGYLSLVAQMVAVGGLLLFGMILIWLFGREFADRTAKDLLAVPTSRAAVVAAKLVVALVWSLLLTVELVVISVALGCVLDLDGWSTRELLRGIAMIFATACLTVLLATTYALAASLGRGYLAAVATLFVTAITAQIVSAVGYGAWFPWAVPSLISGVAGPDQATPGSAGILSVVLVGVAASTATVLWWQHADHDR